MSFLGLGVEAVVLCTMVYLLRKHLLLSLRALSAVITAKNDLLQVMEERLQYAAEFNAKIASSVLMESGLYELTKELSKSVDTQEILAIFKEKIAAIFEVSGCVFLDIPPQENESIDSVFKVVIEEKVKYFILKGCEKADRLKVMVLLNQLVLFLKRARLYTEIQGLSITDGLTGVYVRRHFMERLKEEQLRSAQNGFSFSLLLADVDNFKAYNDTYGHIVGDAVLRDVAKAIKSSLRQIDMCARYGGEEFCIMLPETSKEKAYLAAQRIRLHVENFALKAFNENLKCTISIGVATYPEDARQINDLIDKSDKALYCAKEKGKNRVCASGIKC